MKALSKVENGAGIKIVSSLAEIPQKLVSAVIGDRLPEDAKRHLVEEITKNASIQIILVEEYWGCPPTWRSLLVLLRKLELADLSQKLEEYLRGGKSKSGTGELGHCMCTCMTCMNRNGIGATCSHS